MCVCLFVCSSSCNFESNGSDVQSEVFFIVCSGLDCRRVRVCVWGVGVVVVVMEALGEMLN